MIREELICTICLDFLRDPRELPCSHSFCCECLFKLCQRQHNANKEKLNVQREKCNTLLVCPSCFRVHELPENYGTNLFVSDDLYSELIREMPNNQREKEKLSLHKRQAKLDDLIAGNLPWQSPLCVDHQKPQYLFCYDCNRLICDICSICNHQHHWYQKATEMLPEYLVQLRALVQPADKHAKRAEAIVKQLDQDSEAIEVNRGICMEAIQDTFNHIRTVVNRTEKTLLETISKYIDSKLCRVKECSQNCSEIHGQIIQVVTEIKRTLENITDPNIFAAKERLADELDFHQRSVNEAENNVAYSKFSSTYIGFHKCNVQPVLQEIDSVVSLCEYFPDEYSGYYMSRSLVAEENDDLYTCSTEKQCDGKMLTRTESITSRHECLLLDLEQETKFEVVPVCEQGENQPFALGDKQNVKKHKPITQSLSAPVLQRQLPAVPIRSDSLFVPSPIVQPIKIYNKLSKSKAEIVHPCGICIGEHNSIVVSDINNHCIRIFASNGKFIDVIGNEGRRAGEFEEPCGLAVDQKMNIFVAQKQNARVQKFNPSGKPIGKFGHKTIRGSACSLGEPWGVCVGSGNNVYVTDWEKNCVHVFHNNGRYVQSVGNESLKFPAGITISNEGNLLVVDRGNHCVWMLDVSGNILLRIGSKGQGPGELYYPFGIASNKDGLIAVSESGNNRISIFSSTGVFQKHFGKKGSCPGMFDHPRHLCFTLNSELVVADERNQRLQLFHF